jgi:hypothetical protein
MKKVIIIPGLRDQIKLIELSTKSWSKYGIEPVIYSMNWQNSENFDLKLNNLIKFVDNLSKDELKISVIGCSAGASIALHLFIERQNIIDKAISVCGRLRRGNKTGFRSLQKRAKTSLAFAESVELLENKEKFLNEEQRKRILTIRPFLGDELVPSDTSQIKGAQNITVPILEHSLSIYISLSVFKKKIISFIQK